MSEQNYKNHGRIDPVFHLFIFGILLINLIAAIVHLVKLPNVLTVWFVVLSLTAIILMFKVRLYNLKVQDRVIRLEERIRLQALAPTEWHTQIYRLSVDQLIGLRFAADDEVVELAKHALEKGLNRKQIKERIKNWRADDWRI
jgi:cell division protein FtsL